jgi:hypothetical protein
MKLFFQFSIFKFRIFVMELSDIEKDFSSPTRKRPNSKAS